MSITTESDPERVPFQLNDISQLAIQAKHDRSVIPTLWGKVERLVYKLCNKYFYSIRGTNQFEYDDLVQESYLQFECAVKSYDSSKQNQFSSYLTFFVKKAYRIASGTRTSKRDPLSFAVSMEVPLAWEDDLTLGDTLGDESATEPYKAIEDDVSLAFILEQVDKLHNGTQRFCFIEHAYKNKSLAQIAETLHITPQSVQHYTDSAASNLRRNPFIRSAYPEYYQRPAVNYYTAKGIKAFRTSMSSSVEDTVERIEFLNLIYGK